MTRPQSNSSRLCIHAIHFNVLIFIGNQCQVKICLLPIERPSYHHHALIICTCLLYRPPSHLGYYLEKDNTDRVHQEESSCHSSSTPDNKTPTHVITGDRIGHENIKATWHHIIVAYELLNHPWILSDPLGQ